MNDITTTETDINTKDYEGVPVRTSVIYWDKIRLEKHRELDIGTDDLILTIRNPDEVYRSIQDPFIKLFYRRHAEKHIVAVIKYIQKYGFIVTCYQTTSTKRKGEKLWPK